MPKVGDGVTYGYGADCYPATVIKVSASGKTVWFQDDIHNHMEGNFMEGNARFTYRSNPHGTITKATLRKNGRYHMSGVSMRHNSVYIGGRNYHQDPHF